MTDEGPEGPGDEVEPPSDPQGAIDWMASMVRDACEADLVFVIAFKRAGEDERAGPLRCAGSYRRVGTSPATIRDCDRGVLATVPMHLEAFCIAVREGVRLAGITTMPVAGPAQKGERGQA